MRKYGLLRTELAKYRPEILFQEPRAAKDEQLLLAHSLEYVQAVVTGKLDASAQKAIGFPWSEAMVERSRRSTGATIEALQVALQQGASVNLAGGTHHAKRASGSGFCVFNDAAVATLVAQQALRESISAEDHKSLKVLIVDLDVHQGDGTAEILAGNFGAFTLSMHGEKNFPFQKETSCLDVALADGTGDDEYMSSLEWALVESERLFDADCLIYLAGMDVHKADRLGRMGLTDQGIASRDQMVFDFAFKHRLPVAMSMAGGYFSDLDHLVALQVSTIGRLYDYQRRWIEVQGGLFLEEVSFF